MHDTLTKQAKTVLRLAASEAKECGRLHLGTEYVLLGMLRERGGVAGQLLRSHGIGVNEARMVVDDMQLPMPDALVPSAEGASRPKMTPELADIMHGAALAAKRGNGMAVGTEHILLSILERVGCVATQVLMTLGVDFQRLYSDLLDVMGDEPEYVAADGHGVREGMDPDSLLERFSTDLTAKAARGELDPLIGREQELTRMIQILSRRGKNNPCLIGEPGVGKTAIVEGLARRIADNDVPDYLKNYRIFMLDVAGMVAGTKYRGEFEERMKGILREVENTSHVLLFIDELHTIIGAGGAEGALDAANMMKPALSRGRLQVIGTTSVREYRKRIEKDAALERRFQSILIEEPTIEETENILSGLRPHYESHHGVVISDEAIRAAAELSARYISDRFLPDKAIDLMDEAASKLRMASAVTAESARKQTEEIEAAQAAFEDALSKGDVKKAALAKRHAEELRAENQGKPQQAKQEKRDRQTVGENEVAAVVAEWTHIPATRLTEQEGVRLRRLEEALHRRVIAQDEAISAVSKAVRRGRVGLKHPDRPIGSFLFLGPTGVGKTEIAKALAAEVFGSEQAIIRVDMSEYMEKHSVSRMIGSPPGYVGHDEGGQLSEQVRRHPYAVILFDEIEKAHPDVFHLLLQVLDEGNITDAQGRKVDFKNTIMIMTSNAGAQSIVEPKRLGFAAREDAREDYERMKSGVMTQVRQLFKPEFLNRIDEIIVFHALAKEHLSQIAALMINELTARCKKQMNICLVVTDEAKERIVENAYNPKYGARPLRREIQHHIEDAISDVLLSGDIRPGETVTVAVRDGEIIVSS